LLKKFFVAVHVNIMADILYLQRSFRELWRYVLVHL